MDVDPLYARYPFFEGAREAVAEAERSLAALVEADAPAVDRGRERVERALIEGTVAAETPAAWGPADELLSYPIARVLVSLIDAPAAVDKYAAAEAATAHERFVEDFAAADEGLRSAPEDRLSFDRFLREFDLDGTVAPERAAGPGPGPGSGSGSDRDPGSGPGSGSTPVAGSGSSPAGRRPGGGGGGGSDRARWFRIDVATYLDLVDDWGEEWRLVGRELHAGEVRVEREELYRLLREAVRRRVAEGLPFDVTAGPEGERIADALAPAVADLRDLLSDRPPVGEIDAVVPDLFPPCMTRLLERARRGVDLPPHASFALLAFLVGIGMSADEIVAFCEATALEPEAIRYQTEYLRDDRGTQYPPPSCETLHAYGLCENEDDHWDVAGHPLVYYERMLDDADGDLQDWRDREVASEG